ncbi:cytochrome P450 CYP72A219-like [Spinacia oleracea]|uniref:Cytochrome P450 CYP72A219-like n=1 Tax=Spinacia oleracea TaxID=3562 RepID=A0A9R0JVU5_SPIOL|nr:cytochrome P450 CYP72A219-like [Spinacia oleracea]
MEKMAESSVLLSVVCIIVVPLLMKVVNWVWLRPKKLEKFFRQQGLSGTSYKFLFGDDKDSASMLTEALKNPMDGFSHDYFPRIDPFRHHLATKFGNNFFMWFGPIPVIQISKPELIKELLIKTDEFRKVKLSPIFNRLLPGLISCEEEKWVKHRKLINPAFHVEKLKLMLPAFHDSCVEVVNKWEMLVSEKGRVELDVSSDLMQISADVISRAAFGSNYQEGHKIFEIIQEQSVLAHHLERSMYFPGLSYIPTANSRKFKQNEGQMYTLLKAIIDKRKEETEAGEAVKNDLLGILLDSNSKEIQQAAGKNNKNNQNVGMSLEEVIDECKLFYLAGQETTSTLLVWSMILLSKHQDWQQRAREEVLQFFGDKLPDFEGLSRLKTVNMILYEVLRLYPPVLRVSRWVHKDATLGPLSIPSGAMISVFLNMVQCDHNIWGDDATEFNPERFAEGVAKATKGTSSFIPFGWGPRICIGEKLSMTEVKMAVSMILQRFSLELSPSYIHAPKNVVFLRPEHGAQIILNKL